MDDTYRLKIKVGAHEFEAEGPVQVVQDQFAAFKELIAAMPVPTPPPAVITPTGSPALVEAGAPQRQLDLSYADDELDKIMRLENRVVSLTIRADSPEDGILLLLYGQKMLRSNDAVTGAEIMDGITATGGLSILRADRYLDKLGESGDVIVIGERRSRRYRLTNAGLAKARQSAIDKLSIVA